MKDAVLGIARHLLTAGGGYLVGRGLIDAQMATELTGALATIVGIVWSVYDKRLKVA